VYTDCCWLSAAALAKFGLVVVAAVLLSVVAEFPAAAATIGLALDVCAVLVAPDVPLDMLSSVWLMEMS
jgi:hypothetical protein